MMTQFRPRRLEMFSILFLLLVSGACLETPTKPTPTAPLPGFDEPLQSDGVQILVQEARTRQNFQTYYLMTYADPPYIFYEVVLSIEGTDTPEQALEWGKQNLDLIYHDQVQDLELARWTIVGEDVEYKAGEKFEYRYSYFYKVLIDTDYEDYGLQLSSGEIIDLHPVYQLDEEPDIRPTADLSPGLGATINGEQNVANAPFATVGGGSRNQASATHTTVCGGELNVASAAYTSIAGGRENTANYFYATVGGGFANTASGRDSTIGGGSRNTASQHYATVGGGIQNLATGSNTSIAGGAYNQASELYATICGGTRNISSGYGALIAGGAGNLARGDFSTSTGGLNNQTTGDYSTISGGHGNRANGDYATIPGGANNLAGGDFSLAAGNRAIVHNDHPGVFLFADSSDLDFHSATPNEFAVRASGGVRLITSVEEDGEPLTGAVLPPGSGSWAMLSDRTVKTNLSTVDETQILQKLNQLTISEWSYLSQDASIRHIGPMAGDFYAAFGVGEDSHTINSVDADGIALVAIQGLYRQLKDKETEIENQQRRIDDLERRLAIIEKTQGNHFFPTFSAVLSICIIYFVLQRLKTVGKMHMFIKN